MQAPDQRRPARRELVGAIIGAEAGAGFGLLVMGTTPFAPLWLAALGALVGASVFRVRHLLTRRWLRSQFRAR